MTQFDERRLADVVLVTTDDLCPAGKPDQCCWCPSKIGQPHDTKCVVPQKLVTVQVTVTMQIDVPRWWTKEQIEFHRNESTWCSSNWIEELREIDEFGCICGVTEFEVIGES